MLQPSNSLVALTELLNNKIKPLGIENYTKKQDILPNQDATRKTQ